MDPPLILFLSLTTAHLLADFVLQTDNDIASKKTPAIFAKHILIVTVLSWGLAGEWTNWIIPLVIALSHSLFDWVKLAGIRQGWNQNRLFAWDQAAHLAVIFGLTVFHGYRTDYANAIHTTFGDPYLNILLITAGLVLTVPVGGLMISMASVGFLTQIKNDPLSDTREERSQELREGLRNGGKVIGQLERALIFFFVMVGRPEAVAFLIAAKSVFRFGELTKNARKEAEYILIGTLMSFGWGLAIAWFTRYLLDRF